MSRRAFLQAGIAVGSVLLAGPAGARASGVRPAQLLVRVDPQLGIQGVALAEAYLAALARALRRPVLLHPDGLLARPPDPASRESVELGSKGRLGRFESEPELLLTAQWDLGPAWRARFTQPGTPHPYPPISVIDEAPLSIEASRKMPGQWQALLDAQRHAAGQGAGLSIGFFSGDPVAEQLARAIFAHSAGQWPQFLGFWAEQTLRPALVGNQLDVAILPLRQWPDGGIPGDFGSPWAAHQRGELRIVATAGLGKPSGLRNVPTLDQAMGSSGYHAHWQTVLRASPQLSGPLAERVAAIANAFRQARAAVAYGM